MVSVFSDTATVRVGLFLSLVDHFHCVIYVLPYPRWGGGGYSDIFTRRLGPFLGFKT